MIDPVVDAFPTLIGYGNNIQRAKTPQRPGFQPQITNTIEGQIQTYLFRPAFLARGQTKKKVWRLAGAQADFQFFHRRKTKRLQRIIAF